MDLRAKLERLRSESIGRLGAPSVPPLTAATATDLTSGPDDPGLRAKAERIAQLRALIGEVATRDRKRAQQGLAPAAPSQPRRLPWPCVATALGDLYVHEGWLEPGHHQGRVPLAAALRMQPQTLSAFTHDAAHVGLDLSRALFVDTETTGLAGGTGTVAFLVGLARFEDGALCTEQLIVPELGCEAPVLARLAERLAASSCMVTYNGKSFDWPLLRTRFVLSRMPVPAVPPHVDLLYAARRVFRSRLPALRLADVERDLLHFFREDDIPGHEIPARYFEFVRTGCCERLAPVLEHNRNDLISLVALLGLLIAHYEHIESIRDPRDALALGRLCLRARDLERARAFAELALALAQDADADTARAALLVSSQVHRRLGDAASAAALLEQALAYDGSCQPSAAIHCMLAKLYEHELGAPSRAFCHARHSEPAEGAHAHGRRLGRLHRRLLRRAAGPTGGGA